MVIMMMIMMLTMMMDGHHEDDRGDECPVLCVSCSVLRPRALERMQNLKIYIRQISRGHHTPTVSAKIDRQIVRLIDRQMERWIDREMTSVLAVTETTPSTQPRYMLPYSLSPLATLPGRDIP